MAGLLDDLFNSESGQIGLGLLAAGSARSDGAGFGQRLQEGLGAGAKWKAQQQALEMQKQQMAMHQLQMGELQRKLDDENKLKELVKQFRTPAVVPGAPGTGSTEQVNAALPPEFQIGAQPALAARPAGFDREGFGKAWESIDPLKGFAYQQSIQKDETPITVAPGASLVDKRTLKPLFTAPKEKSLPSTVQEYEYAKGQGYQGTLEQWVNTSNSLKAPKVAVDMRDPTAVAKAAMGFQNDYRTATKDSFQRAQAYESMLQATKDPSAKGDLTMVYSFIKALDPTSVVREGEISLVEANRSIPDKVKGYAQKLATGQSLLPSERQDLLTQAKTLTQTDYRRSRNDVKAYRDNAKRLGLDAELYAPDPYKSFEESSNKPTRNVVKTGMYGGRKVVQYDDGSTEYAN